MSAHKDEILVQDTLRDIKMARTEIDGRRDQALREYEDQLAKLERLSQDVEGGRVAARVAQAQIRRLVATRERGAQSVRGAALRQAGRTTIGMTMPTTQAVQTKGPSNSGVSRQGPSVVKTQASLGKSMAEVDRRIVRILADADGQDRQEARLELAFLLQIRRSLEHHLTDLPEDVILLASVMELTDHAEAVLKDLEEGGSARVGRLLEYDRLLISELLALGGTVSDIKRQVRRARSLLGEGDSNLKQVLEEALRAFAKLQAELEHRFPVQHPSLLDDLVRSTT